MNRPNCQLLIPSFAEHEPARMGSSGFASRRLRRSACISACGESRTRCPPRMMTDYGSKSDFGKSLNGALMSSPPASLLAGCAFVVSYEYAQITHHNRQRFYARPSAFAKISAVEGVHISKTVKDEFRKFDRKGLSPDERRRAISNKFSKPAD
jgi:hypothetical protein